MGRLPAWVNPGFLTPGAYVRRVAPEARLLDMGAASLHLFSRSRSTLDVANRRRVSKGLHYLQGHRPRRAWEYCSGPRLEPRWGMSQRSVAASHRSPGSSPDWCWAPGCRAVLYSPRDRGHQAPEEVPILSRPGRIRRARLPALRRHLAERMGVDAQLAGMTVTVSGAADMTQRPRHTGVGGGLSAALRRPS